MGGDKVDNKIKTVAFDLGGVLAYQDISLLTEEEKLLLQIYRKPSKVSNRELLEYAKKQMVEIFLKLYHLNDEAIPTLEMLKQEKIKSSIWTNNREEINAWFQNVNLYRYIKREDIINSFYLGCDKPKRDFYIHALWLLKNKPEEVFFLDDSEENILGAKECGILTQKYIENENLRQVVEKKLKGQLWT